MFKKKTLSDKLDEQEHKKRRKDELEQYKYDKICKLIAQEVEKQFNKALEALGDRLTFSKTHEGKYNFSFLKSNYDGQSWICCYIFTQSGNPFLEQDWKNIKWEFNIDPTQRRINKLRELDETPLLIENLGDTLINWVNYYLEGKI